MAQTARWARYWDRKSRSYHKKMGNRDRRLLGDSRQWACGQATGEVLEVAIGSGLNLPYYPDDVTLTGVDLSARMLDLARDQRRRVTLRQADAQALPFDDSSFDTVVCTLGLCCIPDPDTAVAEMARVLRPGGRLILVDHVVSDSRYLRAAQRVVELVTIPLAGEHFTRRPLYHVVANGLEIEKTERFTRGFIERLVARKPV